MTTFLVDSNVLLDVVTDDPDWADWSQEQLDAASRVGDMVINPVIYAEVSLAYTSIEDLDAGLATVGLYLREIPRPALFLAAAAFRLYRRRGGTRTAVLPDFFIGAHAEVMRWKPAARDAERISRYFPKVQLLTP